jgi:hypothetical protein
MKSDSVIYNTDTEFAQFFTSSEIWNADGEYLSANEGYYDKARNLYKVTRDGYILSEEQEMWGDTLEYYRDAQYIVARNNIQMDDFKNKVMAFGDYAEYWSDEGKALLTKRPSAVGYDTSQSDTVFISSDSLWIITFDPAKEAAEAAAAAEAQQALDSISNAMSANAYEQHPSYADDIMHQNQQMMDMMMRQNAYQSQDTTMYQGMGPQMINPAYSSYSATSPSPATMQPLDSLRYTSDGTMMPSDSMQVEVVEQVDSALIYLQDSIAKLPAKERKAYYKQQEQIG